MKSSTRPALPAAAGVYRLHAAGVVDPGARRQHEGPTDLLVELGDAGLGGAGPGRPLTRSVRVLASGRPADLDVHPASARSVEIDLSGSVLMPGMVNAHTHLDLTHLGPQPHDPGEGFVAWVDRVRAGRAEEPEAIRASVGRGIELSLRAGVIAVGDIAGAPRGVPRIEPYEALAASPLRGVSFIEFFAMGKAEAPALERLEAFLADAFGTTEVPTPTSLSRPRPERAGERASSSSSLPSSLAQVPVSLGLQPHAPNTVSLPAYRRAVELSRRFGLPLATHLAETPEEREFIARGTGPQREMLERFGIWDDATLAHVGLGKTPVGHLAGVLASEPFLVAHVNDAGDGRAIETLAGASAAVAYCPRASEYFEAASAFGPHRYRDMLAAGVDVCLGTDSVLNLPAGVDGPAGAGLSVLDEARRLFARDRADAMMLVRMMTTHGCRALGLPDALCTLADDAEPAGLVAVAVGEGDGTPAGRVLRSNAGAVLLAVQQN